MKKFLLLPFLFLTFLTSCSQLINERTVTVMIPTHPWEITKDAKMWYSLEWTESGKTKVLYVDTNTREVNINVRNDETVLICAYPLGNMRPFGGFITPESSSTVVLDQNLGYLCDIVIQGAIQTADSINMEKLDQRCKNLCKDYRYIEEAKLLVDTLNGELSDSSVKVSKPVKLNDIPVYSGTWIGESIYDGVLDPNEIELPVGVNRFYNPERGLEMRLVVNLDGTWNKYENNALVPLV